MASVPVLTFVLCRGEFVYECQNQGDTIKLLFQVRFWILTFAVRNRGASKRMSNPPHVACWNFSQISSAFRLSKP